MGINWDKVQFFTRAELSCRCGCGMEPDPDLVEDLEAARARARVPFPVTSCARCLAHNSAAGGVPDSAHMKGLAVDIVFKSSADMFEGVTALIAGGFDRFVFYPGHRIHVDEDPAKPAPMMKVKRETKP